MTWFWPETGVSDPYPPLPSSDPWVIVEADAIAIKFKDTLNFASVMNANIVTYQGTSTPTVVPNAFEPLGPQNFNTISRVLTLQYGPGITPNTFYTVVINGLTDVIGNPLGPITHTFTSFPPPAVSPTVQDEQIFVQDNSIIPNAYTDLTPIIEANPNFYIVNTIPGPEDIVLQDNFNNGRIAIYFSQLPASTYLNSNYFIVQYKPIARGVPPITWTTVTNTLVSADLTNNIVYIDIPSTDATPVYNTSGSTYYLDGYKYRVRVLAIVGV